MCCSETGIPRHVPRIEPFHHQIRRGCSHPNDVPSKRNRFCNSAEFREMSTRIATRSTKAPLKMTPMPCASLMGRAYVVRCAIVNFFDAANRRILTLKPGKERLIANRHPWIFAGAIARESGPPDAAIADLVDPRGRRVASGFHSLHSQIRLRAL